MRKVGVTLVLFGAINWLVVGLVKFDAVASIFGRDSAVSAGQAMLLPRIIYTIIGIAGIYVGTFVFKDSTN